MLEHRTVAQRQLLDRIQVFCLLQILQFFGDHRWLLSFQIPTPHNSEDAPALLVTQLRLIHLSSPRCNIVHVVTRSNAYSGQSNVCTQRDAQAHDHDQRTTHTHELALRRSIILTGWTVTTVGPGRTPTVHWGPYAGRPWVAQHNRAGHQVYLHNILGLKKPPGDVANRRTPSFAVVFFRS